MSGYVVVVYEEEWWIGYVLEKNEEEGIVFLSFLHPHGPSSSSKYPTLADPLWIASCDILCKVNPTIPTGRVYNLPADDVMKAVKAFDDYRAEL